MSDEKIEVVEKTSDQLILEAVKELTKQVGELKDEWNKWRKAGKF